MKCRKCGQPLDETDKFCRNCGARVIKSRLNSAADYRTRKKEETTDDSEAHRNTFRGYIPPQEKFNWNTQEFPGEPHPTEDVNFNWNTFDAFHRDRDGQQKTKLHHKEGDEIAFAPDPERKNRQDGKEMPQGTVDRKESGTVIKETGSSAPQEQEDSLPSKIRENDVTGDELERELFQDIRETSSAMDAEERKKQTAKIDQFYTFNRKNEEFQRLLDREYEKYRAGRPALEPEDREERDRLEEERGAMDLPGDLPESGENVFQKKVIPPQHHETNLQTPTHRTPEQREPSQRDTEHHTLSPRDPADHSDASRKCRESVKHQTTTHDAMHREPEKQEKQEPASSQPESHDPGHHAQEGQERSAAVPQADGIKTKKPLCRTGWTIVAVVVIMILVLTAICLIAPDSTAGEKIRAIPQFFSRQEKTESETAEDHSKPEEDLTRSIQKAADQNQNQAIREMTYNAALRYDGTATYADRDIKNSKILKTNLFYRKNGETYYLNDAIVGEAIRYCSSQVKKGEKLDSFEMGEIRKGKNGYYLWVSENDKRAIFRFEPEAHQMHLTKVYQL